MSSSSVSSSDVSLTPHEFTNLILDNETIPLLNHAFRNDPITHAHIRHYSFVSSEMKHLEYALDRLLNERQTLFDHIMKYGKVERTIQPVVDSYRRRSRTRGFHPYTQYPLTPPPRSSRRQRSPIIPRLSPPTMTHSSGPSSHSSSSSSIQLGETDDEIITAYLQLQGTPHNPIVLDGSDNGSPQCNRCKQYGHDQPNCDTQLRSFTFCEVCKWKQSSQDNCPHFDLSPAAFRTLRGKIPYDEND
jgi:hypothetical protein